MTNLKKMRESKGMTQAELSARSGVNLRMVQNYEQGSKDINKASVTTALALAKALECKIESILEK